MCSGSMREHLPLLKETLKFMVQQLRADDRLSLISFDHEVSDQLLLICFYNDRYIRLK